MVSDRISELPDCLLIQILLHLPISDLVRTSFLSKRWEGLWLNVNELDLNATYFLRYGEALPNLVDRFLEFNRGSCLQKFKIKYAHYRKRREQKHERIQPMKKIQYEQYYLKRREPKHERIQPMKKIKYEQYYQKRREPTHEHIQPMKKIKKHGDPVDCCERVMDWMAEVVHRGVRHLDVEIEHGVECMPKYMYVSKTLVSLKLVNVGLESPKFEVSLPCLKKMHLENISYKGHCLVIVERLISGSIVLEYLTMDFPSKKKEQINFNQSFIVSRYQEPKEIDFWLWAPVVKKPIIFTSVPRCLSSTLEYVKINKLAMKEGTVEIKLVNYFLKNSAVLKKLTLSSTHSSLEIQESENTRIFLHPESFLAYVKLSSIEKLLI